FGIWVTDRGKVRGPRSSVQFGQQSVIARFCFELCYFAAGIIDVSEGYRLCGASRLAGCRDFAVANLAAFSFGIDLSVADPLDTVAAFLHHAPASDCHFRVPHELEAWGLPIGELEEIEPA